MIIGRITTINIQEASIHFTTRSVTPGWLTETKELFQEWRFLLKIEK